MTCHLNMWTCATLCILQIPPVVQLFSLKQTRTAPPPRRAASTTRHSLRACSGRTAVALLVERNGWRPPGLRSPLLTRLALLLQRAPRHSPLWISNRCDVTFVRYRAAPVWDLLYTMPLVCSSACHHDMVRCNAALGVRRQARGRNTVQHYILFAPAQRWMLGNSAAATSSIS